MSALKPGLRCMIVAGCPENIGLIVEVVRHLGPHGERKDAYVIRTLSGRKFNQLWLAGALVSGYASECITDRHKLRPLVEDGDEMECLRTEDLLISVS